MTNRTQPRAQLPPATLHAPTHREAHVDSEEAVQYERHRAPQELDLLPNHEVSIQTSRASTTSRTTPNQNISSRNSSHTSDTNTQHNAHSPLTHPPTPSPIATFWSKHISLTIDSASHRDHLALERTFLAYLRTSLTLATTGILIAQLFRLQHSAHPNPYFGFHAVGRPLSVAFICAAIVVLVLGAGRFWKGQGALMRGVVCARGWEVWVVMGLSVLVSDIELNCIVWMDVCSDGACSFFL
ncbi:hypothetical protein GQ44DRAFT_226866 [Phaeosphaeriaceae sp. PMI808]|nr:hypothetical protein GQ44DRAFT_226866 [Phaeosphaeriaceae sp. PMI808]